jgi:hypothetical protein
MWRDEYESQSMAEKVALWCAVPLTPVVFFLLWYLIGG